MTKHDASRRAFLVRAAVGAGAAAGAGLVPDAILITSIWKSAAPAGAQHYVAAAMPRRDLQPRQTPPRSPRSPERLILQPPRTNPERATRTS